MISLVRVDDRLLHGQIICSWVPYVDAAGLIVASDAVASNGLERDIMGACACEELRVSVLKLADAAIEIKRCTDASERVIVVFGNLADAMKLYEQGLKFNVLNVGNIHHNDGGRKITPSVIIDDKDEKILEKFVELGVTIDIRDVPAKEPVYFRGHAARD